MGSKLFNFLVYVIHTCRDLWNSACNVDKPTLEAKCLHLWTQERPMLGQPFNPLLSFLLLSSKASDLEHWVFNLAAFLCKNYIFPIYPWILMSWTAWLCIILHWPANNEAHITAGIVLTSFILKALVDSQL